VGGDIIEIQSIHLLSQNTAAFLSQQFSILVEVIFFIRSISKYQEDTNYIQPLQQHNVLVAIRMQKKK
jgi:hypothetical protein